MGKALGFLIMLVVMDLFFVITGQICSTGSCGIGSIILSSIIEPGSFSFSSFFENIIGSIGDITNSDFGLVSLLLGAAVLIGTFLASRDFRYALIPIGITLGLLTTDFVLIFVYLQSLNALLAVLLLAPIIMAYTFIILEWVIGKD